MQGFVYHLSSTEKANHFMSPANSIAGVDGSDNTGARYVTPISESQENNTPTLAVECQTVIECTSHVVVARRTSHVMPIHR